GEQGGHRLFRGSVDPGLATVAQLGVLAVRGDPTHPRGKGQQPSYPDPATLAAVEQQWPRQRSGSIGGGHGSRRFRVVLLDSLLLSVAGDDEPQFHVAVVHHHMRGAWRDVEEVALLDFKG